jgi:hypothetical protein
MISAQKIKSIVLTLAVLSSTAVFSAEDNNLNEYYRGVFVGEKKTPNYSGPLDPRSAISSSGLILLDDIFKDQYLNQQIQDMPFSLHRYWFNEVVEKSTCPDSTLNENMDYIRYLYRLVTMSYLFEGVKLNHKMASQLGGKNICSISFKEVFQGCTPESTDMKKFYERVYGKFVNEIEKSHTPQLSKKDMATFIDEFQDSTSLTTNPAFSRLHDWCIANKKNCRTLKVEEIKEALGGFCNDDKKMMKVLCSEKDNFYGLSGISTATDLIKMSNAFNLINQTGMGEECLRRYGKLFQTKESPYASLSKQYPLMYAYLLKNNTPYPQGELFLPGALKEFDMKGLSDFLSALKPPKVEPVVIVRPKAKSKPKPVVVIAPKLEEKAPEVIPVVVAEPEKPHVSEFEHGVLEMKEKNLSSYSLDMDTFRDDFEFTSAMIAELSGPIKKFQTRSALNDMKSYDLLGSAEAPVGLVFLKFLIDTENHQGLYNIVQVLGEKFYVSNDIEKKTTAHYIELKNDASTKNRWTIIMLKK